ncbi:uncharacterized protein [Macrobrachium rosenbergii]|uniref:uncharacterized protein n=1 Tax=Macrobrachium rosenbergii TaxID=79674 RepID=UPI0034D65E79
MPLDDLIETAQHLTDCVKATQQLKAPTQSVSSVQPEEEMEQGVNAVARRRPPTHNKWSSPGLCRYHKWFGKDARNCLPPCSPLSISILSQNYSWDFIIADVGTLLLGADFLAHFGLLVDVRRKRLLDTDSCRSLPLTAGPKAPTISSVAAPPQYAHQLTEFPKKPDGSWRPCGDYRCLNIATEPDHYPLPNMQDLTASFHGAKKADFLGHEVSPAGVRPLTSKVAAVTRFPTPTSVKAVQEFLGMQQAFTLTKAALAEATALAHQDPKGSLQLTTDASNVACGAVLEQVINGGPQPIAFFSKKFNPAETRYSTFDRELCVMYRASGVGEFPQPECRFGHIHVDVVGPLPPSGGSRYLLTVVDHSTRWPEATPVQEATASACAEALLSSWVSRFGVPDHITTERGPAFLSELWSALAQLLGTTHHTTTAYNPAANGLVERFHRSLKASLMAHCTAEDWKHQLPWVLLGLRTAPRADGTPSAAEKTYGEPLVVPGELVTEDRHTPSLQRLRDMVGKFAPCKRTYTGRPAPFTSPGLSSATHVFVRVDAVRPPLTRPYRGPFRVLERNSKAFLLALPGRNDWVSVDRLKPAFLEESTGVTAAPSPPSCPAPRPGPRKQRVRPSQEGPTRTSNPAPSHAGDPSAVFKKPWYPSASQQIHRLILHLLSKPTGDNNDVACRRVEATSGWRDLTDEILQAATVLNAPGGHIQKTV